jgi:hypothetical protein
LQKKTERSLSLLHSLQKTKTEREREKKAEKHILSQSGICFSSTTLFAFSRSLKFSCFDFNFDSLQM